jgi:putative ABC transport system permease protein
VFAQSHQWPGEVVFVLGPYFSVRTEGEPMAVISRVRDIARDLEPGAGLINIATMDQIVSNRVARPRMYTVLLGIFAGIAVVLAAIGVYGVMAYSVSRRTREIGIRMALGAQRTQVIALVLRQSAAWNGIGLVGGLAGATALTRYLESMLFSVKPLDSVMFVTASVLLVAVAGVAAFVPALRATRINPLTALRDE